MLNWQPWVRVKHTHTPTHFTRTRAHPQTHAHTSVPNEDTHIGNGVNTESPARTHTHTFNFKFAFAWKDKVVIHIYSRPKLSYAMRRIANRISVCGFFFSCVVCALDTRHTAHTHTRVSEPKVYARLTACRGRVVRPRVIHIRNPTRRRPKVIVPTNGSWCAEDAPYGCRRGGGGGFCASMRSPQRRSYARRWAQCVCCTCGVVVAAVAAIVRARCRPQIYKRLTTALQCGEI